MLKRTLYAAAIAWPVLAVGQPVTLTWEAYPTPAGHEIEAQCKTGTTYSSAGSVAASQTSLVVNKVVDPGMTLTCRVRAKRTADAAWSVWTPEVSWTRSSLPVAPTGLTISP